ncbi:hypothetical protein GOFOIKOB_5605 [Methylobacterium tardum]|uniref:Lysozyme inhibitor LprI N-terminal domain-containing protein n=1 Tax=Methylobacterium tardum TaxID=374432 RepID=A0AA37T9X8_9HYPH|nr:hypothetical protein [Methylobacterium tardum]URD34617.1 hypothetical protein M6G65_18650 [Methylobacterium tardum]GJE52532.1 hypothetical protein GOFOIKOB_5605 [Methylobacterium tardum]GLS68062.1 hypothetical protein GCM10007890_00730 [Methylobacterium tardum]
MSAATRRAALGAILAAPLASVPAEAIVPAPGQSDLAHACEWASDHWHSISPRCRAENWDDDKLDAEMDLYDEVFERALAEPSATLADLKAKARLCLTDFEAHAFPFRNPEDNSEPDDGTKMVLMVLREVIKLCA